MKPVLLAIAISLFSYFAQAQQYTLNPAAVSGQISLTSAQTYIYFTNTTLSPITTNLTIDSNSSGIAISTNRCASLKAKQTCYIIISFPNYGKLPISVSTFLRDSSSSLGELVYNPINPPPQVSNFSVSSLAMNDFNTYSLSITNKTLVTKSYSPSFSGADASKYSIVLNRCSNIAPQASCSITIKLAPQQAGSFSATLSEAQVTGTVALSSTITSLTSGVLPPTVQSISVNPSSLDFGTIVRIGPTSIQNITITNNGNTSVSPIVSVAGYGLSISLNRCLILLGVNQSCTVSLIFTAASDMDNGPQSGLSFSAKATSSSTAVSVPVAANLNIVPVLLVTNPASVGNNLASISTGSYHSCYVDVNDIAKCWGWNSYGQSSSTIHTSGPLVGKTIKNISAGGWNTCFIASDNLAYCLGYGSSGNLGNNQTFASGNAVATVDTSGVLSGKTIKYLSTGYSHSCVIASDNMAYCWGDNQFGQLGNSQSGSGVKSAVPVAVNMSGVLAGKTMKFIAAGFNHSCGIASDNLVYCWGANTFGQLGDNSGLGSSVPVAVSMTGLLVGKTFKILSLGNAINTYHTCGVASDNKVYCWGRNSSGQIGNGSVSQASVPTAVSTSGALSGKTIKSSFIGYERSCALDSDSNLYCWGDNSYGVFGDGSSAPSNVPVSIVMSGSLTGITPKSISLGYHHTCLLGSNDRAYCWGYNNFGQLGDGTNFDSISPLLVNQ